MSRKIVYQSSEASFALSALLFWPVVVVVVDYVAADDFTGFDVQHGDVCFVDEHHYVGSFVFHSDA
jgi:hypothetical protein